MLNAPSYTTYSFRAYINIKLIKMTRAIFLQDLKRKMGDFDQIEIRKEKYHWGNLRVISIGMSFSIIIHPEHWQKIDKLKKGESTFFKDEQSVRWNVKFDGQNLFFQDRDCYSDKAEVRKSELLMNWSHLSSNS